MLEIEAPDAVLAEGAPAMGGDGFQKLWASKESVAIGGTNPVLVDRVGAAFLGLWNNAELGRSLGGHTTSPLLEVAAKRFGIDLASPAVTGDGASLLDLPRPVHFVGMAPFSIHSDDAPPTKPGSLDAWDATGDVPGTGGADGGEGSSRPSATAAPLGTRTIALDGRGDDEAWKSAPVAEWDTDYAGTHTGIVTRARFLHAADALYALFELERTGLHVDRTRPTDAPRPKLYEEDCVELFLTPDAGKPGVVIVYSWPNFTAKQGSETPGDPQKLLFQNGQLITMAFVPTSSTIPATGVSAERVAMSPSSQGIWTRSSVSWRAASGIRPQWHVPRGPSPPPVTVRPGSPGCYYLDRGNCPPSPLQE